MIWSLLACLDAKREDWTGLTYQELHGAVSRWTVRSLPLLGIFGPFLTLLLCPIDS